MAKKDWKTRESGYWWFKNRGFSLRYFTQKPCLPLPGFPHQGFQGLMIDLGVRVCLPNENAWPICSLESWLQNRTHNVWMTHFCCTTHASWTQCFYYNDDQNRCNSITVFYLNPTELRISPEIKRDINKNNPKNINLVIFSKHFILGKVYIGPKSISRALCMSHVLGIHLG